MDSLPKIPFCFLLKTKAIVSQKNYTRCRNEFRVLFIFFFFSIVANITIAQPALTLSPVINSGLTKPVQFVNAGDGSNRAFIVEQGGTIRAYDASFNLLSVFLTVSNVGTTGPDQGLLSLVFHPDYKNNGLLFVFYTNALGDLELARYKVSSDPNLADASSKIIIITIPHPTNQDHNGGELHFGSDGYLYLSTGDGGGHGDIPNNAQNTSVLLGKILRFNVNTSASAPYYTIPPGNPYGNEIFMLGFRNPFRWSFDKQTHDIWIGDVGEGSREEIDYVAAGSTGGENFGWRCYEGDIPWNTAGCGPYSNYVSPVYTFTRTGPYAAIIGGIVYRGTQYPDLQGYYICAEVYSGTFITLIPNGLGGWNSNTQILSPNGVVDFGEAENGEAYVISMSGSMVYHINLSTPLATTLVSFSGAVNNNEVKLNWQTATEVNLRQFEIEYSENGTSFSKLDIIPAKNTSTGDSYAFSYPVTHDGAIFYRLKIVDINGTYKYSSVIRLVLVNDLKIFVTPSVINNGIINVHLRSMEYNAFVLVSMNGAQVLKENVSGQSGNIKIQLGKLAPGIYLARLIGNTKTITQKIIVQ